MADRDPRAGALSGALAEAVLGGELVRMAQAVVGGDERLQVRRGVELAAAVVEASVADDRVDEAGEGGA